MKLTENIDYSEFFRAVQTCSGEVLLVTPEGDQLNLKSTLSQFVFAAAVRGNLDLAGAKLLLEVPGDTRKLSAYTVED